MPSISTNVYLPVILVGFLSLGCAPNAEEREKLKSAMLREIGVAEETGVTEESGDQSASEALPTVPEGTVDPIDKQWIAESKLPYEHWEIQYMGNQPVGYLHRRIEASDSQGKGTLRLYADSFRRLRSQERESVLKVNLVAFEKENGELFNLEGTVSIGSNTRRIEGSVRNGNLKLTTNLLGPETTISLPWTPSDRGPFAIEQSLIRSPMKEGERRQLKFFDPVLGKPVDVELVAYDFFETPTFQGKKETLLEIQVTPMTGDDVSSKQIWVDREGREHKSYEPALDLRSFRCDKESAMVVVHQSELNALPRRPIKVFGPKIEAFDTGRKRYRVESIDASYNLELPSRTHQVVTTIKPRKLEVIVYPASRLVDAIEGLEPEPPPSEDSLASSILIDANHPQIQLLAERSLEVEELTSADAIDRRAYALRKGIESRVETIDFDGEVSNGRTTLANGRGDCFDHAALLASTCRSNGIHARIAIGLRYDAEARTPSVSLHAWTEFHDGVRWIPLDSSIRDPMVSADRIKWSDTMWDTINPYGDILKVAKHMSNMEVSVMRIDP
jgi:hypothetical protein